MFTNDDKELTQLQLAGLALLQADNLTVEGHAIVSKKLAEVDRVTVVVMGELGDSAALAQLVADGAADVAVFGDYKAAPGPSDVLAALSIAEQGHGVLLLAACAHGDTLTYNIALQQAQQKQLKVAGVLVHDDAGTDRNQWDVRAGLAGVTLTAMIAMVVAKQGVDLEAVRRLSARFANNTATFLLEEGTDIWEAAKCVGKLHEDLAFPLEQEGEEQFLLCVSNMGALTKREEHALLAACTMTIGEIASGSAKIAAYHNAYSVDEPGKKTKGALLTLVRLDEELLALWNKR